jgi:predicted metal-dependent phosphoesterase TrpH
MCTIPVLKRICRECYTTPQQAYETLKRRGMQLVTITDHDEIGASVDLCQHPDFFLSEEVTVMLPSGCEAHVGVYDITERQHIELQARRNDMPRLLAYLRQERLLYSINHMFSSLTGRRMAEDFELFAKHFPAFEVLNGAMPRRGNHAAQQAQKRLNRIGIGGSDSHGHLSLGRAWTQVPGARTKDEFFDGLRARRGLVGGNNGSYMRLSAELFSIAGSLFQDKPWTLGLAPLIALIPVASLINYGFEVASEGHWRKRWLDALEGAPTPAYQSSGEEVAA